LKGGESCPQIAKIKARSGDGPPISSGVSSSSSSSSISRFEDDDEDDDEDERLAQGSGSPGRAVVIVTR
jgi:hypothetical protein